MSNELAEVLKVAARLADAAADAVRRGDLQEATRLQKEAEIAWWRSRRLGQRITQRPPGMKTRSVRERTVTALRDLNVPSSPKQIAAYSEARTGERFDVRGLASIRRDEFRSWNSGPKRDTYVVPALEGPWFTAGRGRFALSHWPLWQRIVGPLSPRTDHLRACMQLISIVETSSPKSDAAKRSRNVLAEYARSVPGALADAWNSGQELDIQRVRVAIESELSLIGPEDEISRKSEAERATRKLTEEQLLWGGARPQLVRKTG